MGVSAGIVGLPNVGKSTIFNALTAAGAQSANYPFCTIEPNVGIVPVHDDRLEKVATMTGSAQTVFTDLKIVDIAGLVRGASKGEGLGNQFLANIRETDAILHVVRCFADDNVVHVEGGVDPARDIEIIETELMLADLDQISKRIERIAKLARAGQRDAQDELSVLQKAADALNDGTPIRAMQLSGDDHAQLDRLNLITQKPVLYVANVSEHDLESGSPAVDVVREVANVKGGEVVVLAGALEAEIFELPAEDRQEFLEAHHLSEPGLNVLVRAAYSLLNLETYFTAGPKEARAWTIERGTKAPQAAGKIHSDFERGFIRAETIQWETLLQHGSEQAARAAGKMRSEGKEYVVQDGDVILFRFNV